MVRRTDRSAAGGRLSDRFDGGSIGEGGAGHLTSASTQAVKVRRRSDWQDWGRYEARIAPAQQ